jgi:hypothetical protein
MSEVVGNEAYVSDMDVRIFLRDTDPEANILIDDFEFGEEEIRTAQTLAVDYWNETPPSLASYNYNVNTFPFRYNLLMAISANLFFIAASLYRRNRLPINIPGGSVDDQAKAGEYDAAGERLWARYKDWVSRKKRELNTNLGWDLV